jgi:hypothetical protein
MLPRFSAMRDRHADACDTQDPIFLQLRWLARMQAPAIFDPIHE